METKTTELVFILDKSGSMAGLEADTIGGFNALLDKQKKEPGNAVVTTVLFNHQYELLHDWLPIQEVSALTDRNYEVGGATALLDAIGSTIQKVGHRQKRASEETRAGKVLVVITTDGMENASCEYSQQKIQSMISHQKNRFDWEFIFLGANIDAAQTARRFGIGEDFAVDYHADATGTELNFNVLNETVRSFRKGEALDRSWKVKIEADFEKRK
ncbi:vWA domain-containing protein [Planococcus salinus]|uniref:VWA domain-containing protein n=1 Tax=Planococcus salinus TaxID=1848460 RepID=A0A3M8PEN8_9BACL|nr:vWA domain-containing protein [Planococcus salinus]RNF41254.1 VWA domain-containing protein [Planococcus salinus]